MKTLLCKSGQTCPCDFKLNQMNELFVKDPLSASFKRYLSQVMQYP